MILRIGHLDLASVRERATMVSCDQLVLSCADHGQSSYIDYVKSHFPKISIVSYGPKAEDRIQL